MSADFAFLSSLTLRMAVSAAFVVTASIITERSGPAIGALIATLPLSAGPAYLFLALDHDATFIAKGAEAGLAINAATMIFCLTYVMLAQCRSALLSIGGAVVVWIVLAALEGFVTWTLLKGFLANAAAFAICIPLLRRFQHVEKLPLVAHYWYDIPLRATMVAALVAIVVSSSHWVGPVVSGAIALFPTVLFSMMLILHARIGGRTTAAMIANGGWAMMGFGLAIAILQVTAIPFGSALALSLGLATCIVWNLALWRLGREK
ncbi:hypothetical protein [Bradyrhizobium sp. JR3.5]